MRLNELVAIDNRFEKSVNLYLDLRNREKIKGYIPTHSSVNILYGYMQEIDNASGARANVLIGPYGKGKSHLLLVLLTLLSGEKCAEIDDLLARISRIDKEKGEYIKDVATNGGQFLPIIVNGSGASLAKSFSSALYRALREAQLDDVFPDNYFSEAIKMIENWKTNYPETYKQFLAQLKTIKKKDATVKVEANEFIRALELNKESALRIFKTIYPRLTSGATFNPNVETDILAVYRSIQNRLCKHYGYRGVYIVFDEFSKYIEGHAEAGFSADMKLLQDMCELCNATKDGQMHMTCVAHKSIKAYGTSLPASILNAYKGVEGRLVEQQFVVTSQNNYELIADAIAKKPQFFAWAEHCDRYQQIIQESYSLKIFQSLFTKEDFNAIVGAGCFPLTPLAAVLLLRLSEKVAQNERTIFTYITSRETNGLASRIECDEAADYIGASDIYDYFAPLFRDDSQASIHDEWLKAEYALDHAEDASAQILIKTIAIIHMVNAPEELPTAVQYLRLASGLSDCEFDNAIEALLESGLIVCKQRTGECDFRNNIGVDIDAEISDYVNKYILKYDLCETLNSVLKQRYVLPKKHNQQYNITRYFEYSFITDAQLLKLQARDYIKTNHSPDGLVLLVLPIGNIDFEIIKQHVCKLADPCLAVCVPAEYTDCTTSLTRLLAVQKMKTTTAFADSNQVLIKELTNIENELIAEINEWVTQTYGAIKEIYTAQGSRCIGRYGFNRTISDICDETFNKTPRINHELVNRHVLSSQILKARNLLLRAMLDGEDFSKYATGTSAEATIYRAVMINTVDDTALPEVSTIIHDFLISCRNRKQNASDLINKLTQPPYGMRRGVIPFYIVEELTKMDDYPILYMDRTEMALSSDTISLLVASPERFFVFIEEATAQKAAYLDGLEEAYKDYKKAKQGSNGRAAEIADAIQCWYRALPQASHTFQVPDYAEQNVRAIIVFRRLFAGFSINASEVVLEKVPKMLGDGDYAKALESVLIIKKELENHIHCLANLVLENLRTCLQLEAGSVRASLNDWYVQMPIEVKRCVLSQRAAALLTFAENCGTSDPEEIAGKVAKLVTGIYLEDWKDNQIQDFVSGLEELKHEYSEKKTISEDRQEVAIDGQNSWFYDFDPDSISATGTFFKSAIEASLDEFGDSIDANEKIGILMEIIKTIKREG